MNVIEDGMRPKYRIPRLRKGAVERRRLFVRLDEAAARPVTLINAAAGSGKTSLVAHWLLHHAMHRVAWLRLDAEDRDATRLLRNILASARSALGDDAHGVAPLTQAMLSDPAGRPLAVMVESLAIELGRVTSRPSSSSSPSDTSLLLVLDDYHEADGADAQLVIEGLVKNLGATVSLIILTRSTPTLPLAAWQARAEVAVLSQRDMAFSDAESFEFFRSTMGLALHDESIRSLHARTEGWIAGLQLAALSLQASPEADDIDLAARTLTARNRYIADYLSHDFLDHLDAGEIRFLEQTSVLDSLCARLCDALTGQHDSADRLRDLERQNLFITPLDGGRDWYRYHDIFREFLVDRLDAASRARLHWKAGEWFAARGEFEDAFRHARAADDIDGLVDFLRRHAEAAMCSDASSDLLGWITLIPADVQNRHPDMMGVKAWKLYLRGTEREAEPYARAALARLDDPRMQTGLMLAFRAYAALRWQGPGDVAELSTAALGRLAPGSHRLRSLMFSYRGQAQALAGQADAAIASYLEVLRAEEDFGQIARMSGTLIHLVELLLERGRSAEARGIASDFVRRASAIANGLPPPAGNGYVAMAEVHLAAHELQAARDAAETGLRAVDQGGLVYFQLLARTTLARVLHAQGERSAAWRILEEARQLSQRSGGHTRRSMVETTIAELHLQDGNAALAAYALSQVERSATVEHTFTLPLLQARLLMIQKRHAVALSLLSPALARAETEGYVRTAIEAGLLIARNHEHLGDRAEAVRYVRRALVLAAAGRYLRLFVASGRGIAPLLTASASAAPAFANEIASALVNEPEAPGDLSNAGLTPKDVEVLTLISRGLQNKEIAEELDITVGTAKQYVNRLYVKLGTRNRVEAITEGRRLHLIA